MSRIFVRTPEFEDALARAGLDTTSPEAHALEITIRNECQRRIASNGTVNGGNFFISHVNCRGGGRLLAGYLDDGSIVTLLNAMINAQ